jgi:Mn-containing catalase
LHFLSTTKLVDLFLTKYFHSTGHPERAEAIMYKGGIQAIDVMIVRDLVHEKVFAKALETLGVRWGKALPVPRINTEKMPEVRDLERKNLHNIMWTFANNGEPNGMAQIFKGESPFDDGGPLEVLEGFPEGADTPMFPEAPEEFSPGLDTELKKMAQELKVAK